MVDRCLAGEDTAANQVEAIGQQLLAANHLWPAYRLARMCAAAALHSQASPIFRHLAGTSPFHTDPPNIARVGESLVTRGLP